MDVARVVAVTEASQVAEARRAATACATELALSDVDTGRAALVATELATNLVKHGGGGSVLVQPVTTPHAPPSVAIVAIDRGAGMADVARCLEDGYSTAGSAGTGLGAISRATRELDVYSMPGRGTVAVATVGPPASGPGLARLETAALATPYPGESVSGDAISIAQSPLVLSALVVDGLGHGQHAAAAAAAAVAIFAEHVGANPPGRLVERIHQGLRHTRGAAGLVVSIDVASNLLTYSGVGNISGAAFHPGGARRFVSHNGILGHECRRVQEFTLPWSDDALLVVHSDGISAHFKPEDYPGLVTHGAPVIAATVYRDFRRQRDDASVLVAHGLRNGPAIA